MARTSKRRRRHSVQIEDPGKFALLCLVILTATTLRGLELVSEATWAGITLAVSGYLTGNGRLARRGRTSVPAIAPARRRQGDPPEPDDEGPDR